ncbi:MAG TPA: DUF6748 domain-containing protein [Gaiellaceae bacterium]|nr:DUF6748 domain-containing protein [Gaiellaceae bacterium]
MVSRGLIVAVLALVVSSTGAAPAGGEPGLQASYAYLARADPRLRPSPYCGGLWVRAVNKPQPPCPGPVRGECYVASTNFDRLPLREVVRARLASRFAEGRALVVARVVSGQLEAFPELAVLEISEVWTASSSPRKPAGVFRRIQDNGVRCVTTPCFSIVATALNTDRVVTISDVDLSRVGASQAERKRALALIAKGRLIASGQIVADRNAGPASPGRKLVARQFYIPVFP